MNPASKRASDVADTSGLDRATTVRTVIGFAHRISDGGKTPQDHPLHFDADDEGVAV